MHSSHFPVRQAVRIGRYQLLVRLGKGQLGDVHLALASARGGGTKLVVLKELGSDFSFNPDVSALFLHEGRRAGQLNHANIVHTFEARKVGGRYFVAVEYLEGHQLAQLLADAEEHPKIPPYLRIQILCDALMGLHHAHQQRDFDGLPMELVHGAFGPSNVFVTYDGHVKVVDFGMARVARKARRLSHDSGFAQGFSRTSDLGRCAPEQLTGQAVDRRTDVFCAGLFLWELLMGQHMVPATSDPHEALGFIARSDSLRERLNSFVDPDLARICRRALRIDPKERYASALELRTALTKYLSNRTGRAEPSQLGDLVRSKMRRRRKDLARLVSAELGRRLRISESVRDDFPFEDETKVAPVFSPEDDSLTIVDDSLMLEDDTSVLGHDALTAVRDSFGTTLVDDLATLREDQTLVEDRTDTDTDNDEWASRCELRDRPSGSGPKTPRVVGTVRALAVGALACLALASWLFFQSTPKTPSQLSRETPAPPVERRQDPNSETDAKATSEKQQREPAGSAHVPKRQGRPGDSESEKNLTSENRTLQERSASRPPRSATPRKKSGPHPYRSSDETTSNKTPAIEASNPYR